MNKPTVIKAVIYARVSSKEQEKEGFSIPAQLKLLKEYADREGFVVVHEYVDAETAKRVGRTNFQLMLDNIKQGEATVLLVEKTDRLTRNLKDEVLIDDLIQSKGLEVHYVKEGEILGPNAKSHTKLIHGIKVVLAKNYIDNLAEEIKKGQREKAEQGWYPHPPPYGYKGEKGKIVIALEAAAFVTRLYELYATGKHSITEIPKRLHEEGFEYRPSTPKIPPSRVEGILKHPFYRGNFELKGAVYKGKHERFISDELIHQVERILKLRGHKSTARSFLYQGIITCANCGCQVVGELQKGRYIYYSCTNGRKVCKRIFVREENLNLEIESLLETITPTAEQYEWLQMVLKSSHADEQAFHKENIDRLQAQIKKTDSLLSRIYDDCLEGLIDRDMFQRKRQELAERRQELNKKLEEHYRADGAYQDKGLQILEIARNAASFYKTQDNLVKRDVLKTLLSNCTLQDKELRPELHFAFSTFVEMKGKRKMVEATGVEPATSCVQSRRSTN
jgi:site-specific DNA recombinase